jgi:N-acetylmuramidase
VTVVLVNTGPFCKPVSGRPSAREVFRTAKPKPGNRAFHNVRTLPSSCGDAGVSGLSILFEAHVFSKNTRHAYDYVFPEISSRHWNRALYRGGEREYPRLMKAMLLDRAAALKSASWGRFQVMGFNHSLAGERFTGSVHPVDVPRGRGSFRRLRRLPEEYRSRQATSST